MKLWRKIAVGFVGALGIFLAGCSDDATTTATVLASAGPDQEVAVADTVQLDGQASTGVDAALWSISTAPGGSSAALSDETTLTPTFVPDVAGDYVMTLSVNSDASTDTVTITVKTIIAKITSASGSTIASRTRFGSTENVIPLGDTGAILSAETSRGAITSYLWEQVAGPGATATNGAVSETLEFTAPELAEFLSESDKYKWQPLPISRYDTRMVFKLTVSDVDGNTDTDTYMLYAEDETQEIYESSGLPNVGVGTPVYLSGPTYKAGSVTAVTDWSWTLTSVPSSSAAVFVDSDAATSSLQVPKFVPDLPGLYIINYTSVSAVVSGSITLNAADWTGVGTIETTHPANPQCALCHDGSIEADRVTGWQGTKHAGIFEDSMDIFPSLAPEPYLWRYETVGYNTSSAASNSGFDDAASTAGFTQSTEASTFAAFIDSYPSVAKYSNVQCENCHGPGSQHAGDPLRIGDSFTQAGVCGQCHVQESQWVNSGHNSTGWAHGRSYQGTWLSNAGCTRCHAAEGFANYVEGGHEALVPITAADKFVGITCAGCHDPHNATNDAQLRVQGDVEMIIDGSTVDAGKAAVCFTCHDGLYSHGEDDCDSDHDGRAETNCAEVPGKSEVYATATEYMRQVHYNPQAPVLQGKGAISDLDNDGNADFTLDENSFHTEENFTLAAVTGDSSLPAENNKCVTCHMSEGPAADEEGYLHLGGHAFKLRSGHSIGHLHGGEEPDDSAEGAGELELITACTPCHPSVTEINRTARADYDGDGSLEGIQDEALGILLNLGTKLKDVSVDTGDDVAENNTTNGNCTLWTYSGTYADACATNEVPDGTLVPASMTWAGTGSSLPSRCSASEGGGAPYNQPCVCATVEDVDWVDPTLPLAQKDADYYQPCNFAQAADSLKAAVWNYNLFVRDASLGIHNAAYTIQVLQGTWKGLTGSAYNTAYPSAVIR